MPPGGIHGGWLEAALDLSSERERSAGRPPLATLIRYEQIWAVVSQIPTGRVATYGDIARMAGIPGGARQAGRAMRFCPPELALPWHRVVAAGGRIALSGEHGREQRRRLERENVPFAGARVRLDRCRWDSADPP